MTTANGAKTTERPGAGAGPGAFTGEAAEPNLELRIEI
jgi:hypothetical protein